MSIKQLKPYTATTRFQNLIEYNKVLDKIEPLKDKLASNKRTGGRNNTGRITVRHQGGGNKKKYRIIDWKWENKDINGVIEAVEYDPNRSAFIARIKYLNGARVYTLATEGVSKGSIVSHSENADIKPGNSLPLAKIPAGTQIHSVELKAGAGAKIVRSAGAHATLVGKLENYAQVRLPSGELRLIPQQCYATIGTVSNGDHMNISLGKAGKNRWKGIRPTVRGVAQNPVDHPMGGGEGKSSGGRHPCSPWGQLAKGLKTRKKKNTTNKYIITRRK